METLTTQNLTGSEKQIEWAKNILENAQVWMMREEKFINHQQDVIDSNSVRASEGHPRATRRVPALQAELDLLKAVTAKLQAIADAGDAHYIIENRDVLAIPGAYYHEAQCDLNSAISFARELSEI